MSLNLNKVVLAGRLTVQPELKVTTSGIYVTTFTLAVNRKFSGKNSDNEADFINCVAWRKTAEFITQWFSKGSAICITGSIQTRSWTSSDGSKRYYATEVVAEEVDFVESKKGASPAMVETPASFITNDTMLSDDDLPF